MSFLTAQYPSSSSLPASSVSRLRHSGSPHITRFARVGRPAGSVKNSILILALFFALSGNVYGPQSVYADENEPSDRQLFAMTTVMNLRAYGKDSRSALDDAETQIRRLDSLLSTGTEGSEVWQINRDGGGTLSEDTAALTESSLKLYDETGGAFDFTIYPIMNLWGFTSLFDEDSPNAETESASTELTASSKSGDELSSTESALPDSSGERAVSRIPTQEEIDALLPLVDSSKVRYDPDTQKLTLQKEMQIDFGGIAKGYTSQKIMKIFSDHGLAAGLADLGGNIQVTGQKPDGSPWRVGIEDPSAAGALLGILTLEKDCAVITSGSYERYLIGPDGKHYSHIIDPSTGYPVDNDLSSVSIICEDGTLADGLSTSLCVMGKDKAVSFWKKHSGSFDMVLFDTDQTVTVSEGLEDSFRSDSYSVKVVHKN